MRWLLFTVLALALAFTPLSCRPEGVKIGSKKFTESVLLGEALVQLARSTGTPATHYAELGGTRLIFESLQAGELDIYPEYTGTLREELFKDEDVGTEAKLRDALARLDLRLSRPLGFNNTYALGMRRDRAEALGIETISDLARHPDLQLGFSNEFVKRDDGWQPLRERYGLPHENVSALDHDIAYRQLELGELDVIDIYTTDAKIAVYDIQMLVDDREFFPRYDAVLVYRADLETRYPEALAAMLRLEGSLDEPQMLALNEASEVERRPEPQVMTEWLESTLQVRPPDAAGQPTSGVLKYTIDHLELVRRSLIPAILVGIPLGILAARYRRVGQLILGSVGVIQTIPALALLVLLMPIVSRAGFSTIGGGSTTAVVALFLYCLLPIVRGTHTGLTELRQDIHDAAASLRLPSWYRLFQIELPLASRNILAGIKTATVINIGFATLGALIGAGGYGEPILTGIRLLDTPEILKGAIPAALLALVAQFGFELAEPWLVPRGLLVAGKRAD